MKFSSRWLSSILSKCKQKFGEETLILFIENKARSLFWIWRVQHVFSNSKFADETAHDSFPTNMQSTCGNIDLWPRATVKALEELSRISERHMAHYGSTHPSVIRRIMTPNTHAPYGALIQLWWQLMIFNPILKTTSWGAIVWGVS